MHMSRAEHENTHDYKTVKQSLPFLQMHYITTLGLLPDILTVNQFIPCIFSLLMLIKLSAVFIHDFSSEMVSYALDFKRVL